MRGMECVSASGFAEAFYGRMLSLLPQMNCLGGRLPEEPHRLDVKSFSDGVPDFPGFR
jgi:hypothetical protein